MAQVSVRRRRKGSVSDEIAERISRSELRKDLKRVVRKAHDLVGSDDLHSALCLSVVTQRDAPLGHYDDYGIGEDKKRSISRLCRKYQSANEFVERIKDKG